MLGSSPALTAGNVNLAQFLRGLQLFGPSIRSQGDFGVGQGVIPTITGTPNSLLQKRLLRPIRSAARR